MLKEWGWKLKFVINAGIIKQQQNIEIDIIIVKIVGGNRIEETNKTVYIRPTIKGVKDVQTAN